MLPALVAEIFRRGYSPPMSDKLNALLERLKAHQRTLIMAMAEHKWLSAGKALRPMVEPRTCLPLPG